MRVALGLVACAAVIIAVAWPKPWEAVFGSTEGAACTVLGDSEGIIFGGNCRPLDSGHVRVALSEERDLSGLSVFTSLEDVSIQVRDQPVDLRALLEHPQLRSVSIMGPLEEDNGVHRGAELDLSPLAELPNLVSLELVALADVDLRPLNEMSGLRRLELVIFSAEYWPDLESLSITYFQLWLVSGFPLEQLAALETVSFLKLSEMQEVIAVLPDIFPNVETLKVDGETLASRALLAAIEGLDRLSEVEVWDPSEGRTVEGREAMLDFLRARIE